MWIRDKFYKYSIGIILILVIIFLIGKIDFFLAPFKKFLAIIFIPLLIAGLLYYLFRPLVRLAKKLKLPSTAAILVVFLFFIVIFAFIAMYAGSLIGKQFQQFIGDLPQLAGIIRNKAAELMKNESIASLYTGKIQDQLTTYLQKLIPAISGGLVGAISTITSVASVLVVVPFILFYLLKDDRVFFEKFSKAMPEKYRDEIIEICQETDKTLSTYIIGQAIIALILGTLTYIGYLIIGLNYAMILSFFVLITSFIPMFGSIIGVIPAFLVGLAVNPWMAVKVVIIMVIVQQTEGNLISPHLIGKRLAIHPLTIIIIFLGAGSLYGFIGMLIAVPAYAVLKVVAVGAVRIFGIWRNGRTQSKEEKEG